MDLKISKKVISTEKVECNLCGSSKSEYVTDGKDYLHNCTNQNFTFVQCLDCSHLYLNPRPKINQIDLIYPSDYSTYERQFGKKGTFLTFLKDFILVNRFKKIEKYLPKKPKILDIGCGDGAFLLALRRKYPTSQLYGLDFKFGSGVKEELNQANISVIESTVENVKFNNIKFDLITANQIIEHVWDVSLVLKKCYKILGKNGIISLETPNPNGWDRFFFYSKCWGGYYIPRHLNLFSKKHLKIALEKHHFNILEQHSLLAPPCWIYSLHFFFASKGMTKIGKKLFSDTSIFWLATFALIDLIAKFFNAETSNQKIIAKKNN